MSEFDAAMREFDAMESVRVEIWTGVETVEAQAWMALLRRMYARWAKRRGWTVSWSAGAPLAPLVFRGDGVSGAFAAEDGVHRLVSISPFDPEDRRHTSFALVSVDGVGSSDMVRSYVLDPYKLAKDHHRNAETEQVEAVLDGDVDLIREAPRGGETASGSDET